MRKKKTKIKFSGKHNDILLTGLLLFVMLAIELTMLFFNRLFFLNVFGVLNDVFFYFILILAINFIKNIKLRKIVYTVFFSIFAALFLIDSMYSAFFGGFTSIDSLTTLGNLFIKTDVGVSIPLAAIIIGAEMALGIFLIWFIKIKTVKTKLFYHYATAIFLATVISVTSINVAIISSVKNKEYPTKIEYYASNSFLYNNFYNSYKYTIQYGYINYRIRDFTYSGNNDYLIEDITKFYQDSEESYFNENFTGIFEGYNLVTVLCETMDVRIIEKNLMPNFTSVMENSLIFENYYVPTFFEAPTINSEYMSLTGMFPIGAKSWVSSMGDHYKHNNFKDYSLPGQLSQFGYETYYAHLGYENFYSRKTLMPNLGFNHTYFIEDLDYTPNFFDIELIDMLDNVDFSEKFYLDMLTYSMHKGSDKSFVPKSQNDFTYENYNFVKDNYPQYSSQTQIYLTKARMFDDFVGALFDRLDTEGVLDNTIVLFYPDHYTYGNSSVLSDLNLDERTKEIHHQFLTMYLPEGARNEVLNKIEHKPYKDFKTARSTSLLGATVDLAPTLLNLLTTNGNFKYFAGQDLFAGNNFIFFSDYTVFDGDVFYNLNRELYTYKNIPSNEVNAHMPLLSVKLEQYVETTIMHGIMLDIDYFTKIKTTHN